jgi:hypothetical protein
VCWIGGFDGGPALQLCCNCCTPAPRHQTQAAVMTVLGTRHALERTLRDSMVPCMAASCCSDILQCYKLWRQQRGGQGQRRKRLAATATSWRAYGEALPAAEAAPLQHGAHS